MRKSYINGDTVEGISQRLRYFFQCLINHQIGDSKAIKLLQPSLIIKDLDISNLSPSRALCNSFWKTLDYTKLEIALESKLHFCDLGCGDGKYGNFFKNWTGQSFGSYTGIDIYKNDKFPDEFEHKLSKAESAHEHINGNVNVIVSQSALEHIENDIEVLESLTRKLIKKNKNFIQIHLVPASASLWLYLFHGWRQYSKKNLGFLAKKIKKVDGLEVSAVALGGKLSFWIHLRHITFPYVLNKLQRRENRQYKSKNISQIILSKIDQELNCNGKIPSFWALIIHKKDHEIGFK